MNTLLKTRCNKGHLILTEKEIIVDLSFLGTQNTESIPYSQVTGVQLKTTQSPLPFIFKGIGKLTIFSKGDQMMELETIKLPEAKLAKEIIDSKLV